MPIDKARVDLIQAIQQHRGSKVLVYFTGDRPGRETQMAEDVVPLIYKHVGGLPKTEKLDVFLYTRGGIIFAPWRLITLLREIVSSISVLIPFRCHSAGTLFALGADEIWMTKLAELSPVDPQFVDNKNPKIERRSVEDVLAFISFAKDKVGIIEQAQLSVVLDKLTANMSALDIGRIHRGYNLIRLLVNKLLSTHMKAQEDEPKITAISENMTEKLFDHEYKIGRREAKDFGLNVKFDDEKLESLICALYLEYERLLGLREPPWIPDRELGKDQTKTVKHLRALLESENLGHHFTTEVQLSRGAVQPQFNLQGLPPNLPPALVQQIGQQIAQQLAPQGQVIVKIISEGWSET